MGHIIQEYEKNLGVEKSVPIVNKHFFPTNSDNYILIYAPQNIPAKIYKHYFIVVDLLKDFCRQNDVKIYQIGKSEDLIKGVDKAFFHLSFRQEAYLIYKSRLFVCVDSVYSQYASSCNVACVNLFGNVFSSVTRGAWNNRQINLEPEWTVKPSLQHYDADDNINKIKPEKVVSAIIKLIDSKSAVNFKTHHIGDSFYQQDIDVVPTDYKPLPFFQNKILNIRADYAFDEQAFLAYCCNHKCRVFLKNLVIPPVKIQNFAANIEKITFIFDDLDNPVQEKYFEILKNMKIETEILITDENLLTKARLIFFDQNVNLYKPHLQRPEHIPEDSFFFSMKKVIEGDKVFHSKAHWKNQQNIVDKQVKIVDTPDYWEELDYYYIYEQK